MMIPPSVNKTSEKILGKLWKQNKNDQTPVVPSNRSFIKIEQWFI